MTTATCSVCGEDLDFAECPRCAALPRCVQCRAPFESRQYADKSDMCDSCRCESCGSHDEPTTRQKIYSFSEFYDDREMMVCRKCHKRNVRAADEECRGDYERDMRKDGGL